MLEVEAPAPDFASVDQHGNAFRLSSLRGRWVVVYFYPKDETRGCTMEACTFRDRLEEIARLGAEVVGGSVQDRESHRQFSELHRLNFRLVADPDKTITRAYDALGILGVAKRVTYILDPGGRVRDAHRSEIDPRGHVAHAEARLRELGAIPSSP